MKDIFIILVLVLHDAMILLLQKFSSPFLCKELGIGFAASFRGDNLGFAILPTRTVKLEHGRKSHISDVMDRTPLGIKRAAVANRLLCR